MSLYHLLTILVRLFLFGANIWNGAGAEAASTLYDQLLKQAWKISWLYLN